VPMNDRAPSADPGGGVSPVGWEITVESRVSPEVRRAIEEGLTRHALPATRIPGFEPLAVLAHDRQGALAGGAIGTINWNWLHVSLLWVSEACRHAGLGSRLLTEMERVAAQRGCTRAHLDTFSYQARPFYERLGYRLFGVLEDYPPGHRRFFLEKALDR
jgi:GNAT superfamily N-acetyltransferase